MKELDFYQIDAFTDTAFKGNPAAVCLLDEWLPDEVMQKIAMENNLAETAFLVKNGYMFNIRWFTPTVEVDLCGHATLAAAHALFEYHNIPIDNIMFNSTRSGLLNVEKVKAGYMLDFPTDEVSDVEDLSQFESCFNKTPLKAMKGKTDYILVFSSQDEIENIEPNLNEIKKFDARGIIVTAKGDDVDFVSRFFAPQSGIDEDPVTGSAHTSLTPYWASVLEKDNLTALQLSERGGKLTCRNRGKRSKIIGDAVTVVKGKMFV